jgi:beta-catenin-like protein 1
VGSTPTILPSEPLVCELRESCADGDRFIDSEADLDAMLKQFLPLTQNPALYYPELINSGAVSLFANLLSHENTDIAVDVVEVLQELTDEDIGEEDDLDEDGEDINEASGAAATRLALAQIVDELVSTLQKPRQAHLTKQLSHSIFELLVSNLSRLSEEEDADRQGVFHILGMCENLLTFMPPLADQLVSSTKILPWLLDRISRSAFDSNKQYASEILAILLQRPANVVKALELGGVETLLMVLAVSSS